MTAITPKHFRSIERRRKAGTFGRKSWRRKEKQELAAELKPVKNYSTEIMFD